MSDWPVGLALGPIREWPGPMTRNRVPSQFKRSTTGYRRESTPLSDTLTVLNRELRMLGARNVELLIAMRPEDFRRDGMPRANATPAHPGVILSFDSKHGPLSWPCDTFTRWQDNLRAIALALDALRKVDRYGVTSHGQQYRGFLALEAPRPMQAGFDTVDAAMEHILEILGESMPSAVGYDWPASIRLAKRKTHPDLPGGDAERFRLTNLAGEKIMKEYWNG